ncbi:hypothetical protein, partial [Comamonas sp. 4034]|uniref:hypothetical protein n=1 Tax=Comamonas sp. 4034 TaxID=3156455 RepID=UPI003D245328
CGAVLAPTPVRLTHHPSLLPLRPGFVQQSRPIVENKKTLPQYMHAAAKFCQNMWIIEVKREYEHLFTNYPDEAILGYWYVDNDGVITKKFRPTKYNSEYK